MTEIIFDNDLFSIDSCLLFISVALETYQVKVYTAAQCKIYSFSEKDNLIRIKPMADRASGGCFQRVKQDGT